MVLQYYRVEDSSFLLSVIPNASFDSNINAISECSDPNCIYSRNKSRLREKFEETIHCFVGKRTGIKILFYGSFLLAQELKIIALLSDKISEIHLTDFAYTKWEDKQDNIFNRAIMQLMEIIYKNKLNVKVYLHVNPKKLITSRKTKRRFDVICGIDIDYSDVGNDHRSIMKNIAKNCLKIDSMLCISQHSIDQVDICYYKLDKDENIVLAETTDYVKDPFYTIYWREEFFNRFYGLAVIFSLLLLHFSISVTNIYTIISLLYVYAAAFLRCIRKRKSKYKRRVKRLDSITV